MIRGRWPICRPFGTCSAGRTAISHQRPDAVVLVDYPGFNWWIARRAKAHGIPVLLSAPHFGPGPNGGSRNAAAGGPRAGDAALEEAWFQAHGCRATYVGHPFFDNMECGTPARIASEGLAARHPHSRVGLVSDIPTQPPARDPAKSPARPEAEPSLALRVGMPERPGPLVLILPGSRTQEVAKSAGFPEGGGNRPPGDAGGGGLRWRRFGSNMRRWRGKRSWVLGLRPLLPRPKT